LLNPFELNQAKNKQNYAFLLRLSLFFLKDKNKDEFEDELFIVPEKAHPCAFIDHLCEQKMLEDDQVKKLYELYIDESINSIFEKIN